MSEWISVDDELPKEGRLVDAWHSHSRERTADAWYSENAGWWLVGHNENTKIIPKVSYWMERPWPPE